MLFSAVLGACASTAGGSASSVGGQSAGGEASASGGAVAQGGSAPSSTGGSAAGGSPGEAGGVSALGGAAAQAAGGSISESGGGPTSAPSGGTSAGGKSAGGASASTGGASASGSGGKPASGGGGAPPASCGLSNPVSFQKDIQVFLATSCGKGVSSGCHVTDSSKTGLGYDHAYDWITAVAHPTSCGKTPPYAKRFEVVLAVLQAANPPSCPNSRIMPPAGMGTPLNACQVAALQAWLGEDMVSQMHVAETDDTKTLYPPGPYLMPPFN